MTLSPDGPPLTPGGNDLPLARHVAQEQSTAHRLDAMRAMIQTWDWHTAPASPADQVDPPTETLQLAPRRPPSAARMGTGVLASLRAGTWRWVAAGLALAVVIAVVIWVSLGSTPRPSQGSPSVALLHSEAAAQFLGAERAAATASTAVTAHLAGLPGLPTVPNVSEVVTPYLNTLMIYQLELANIRWPAALTSSGAALLSQVKQFTAFDRTISSTQSNALGAWLSSFRMHSAAVNAQEGRIRHELGISPRTP